MDVPTWHPANQDADARSKQDNENARTEFKVMPGSSADTSTVAGQMLLNELAEGEGSAAVEGRGFFDVSDRLYLEEQRQLDILEKDMMRAREEKELEQFRSHARKHQTQKTPPPLSITPSVEKTINSTTSSVVIVKRKEKRTRSIDQNFPAIDEKSNKSLKVSSTPSTSASSLGLGYSSD